MGRPGSRGALYVAEFAVACARCSQVADFAACQVEARRVVADPQLGKATDRARGRHSPPSSSFLLRAKSARITLRASVGSTDASASLPARFGVVGPTRAGIDPDTSGQGDGGERTVVELMSVDVVVAASL